MASRFRRSMPFISLTVWSQLAPSGTFPLRTSFRAWTTTSMALLYTRRAAAKSSGSSSEAVTRMCRTPDRARRSLISSTASPCSLVSCRNSTNRSMSSAVRPLSKMTAGTPMLPRRARNSSREEVRWKMGTPSSTSVSSTTVRASSGRSENSVSSSALHFSIGVRTSGWDGGYSPRFFREVPSCRTMPAIVFSICRRSNAPLLTSVSFSVSARPPAAHGGPETAASSAGRPTPSGS